MSLHGLSDGQKQPTFSRRSGRKCCDKEKTEWEPDAFATTYQREYYEKEVARSAALHGIISAPREPPTKFDPSTTYGGDFKHYEAARRDMIRPPQAEQEKATFQGQSTYASNFDPKTATYHRVKPEYVVAKADGPFEEDTTNKQDYKHWGVPKPRTAFQQPGIPRSKDPFVGQSVYADNFRRHPIAKREPAIRLGDSDAYPKGPLDTTTIYNTAYTGQAVEATKTFRPPDSKVQDLGWYDGVPTTEYSKQFIEKAGGAAQPAEAMAGQRPFPNGRFDDSTNYKADFQPREGDRTQSMKPKHMLPENLPFTGESTYADTFVKRDGPQYQRVRPKNTFEPNPAPFQGQTTNKADFLQWETAAPVRAMPTSTIRTAGAFEDHTTYKGAYQRVQAKPATPIKPLRQAASAGPFDGTTTYNLDYVQKEREYVPERPSSVCSSCRERR